MIVGYVFFEVGQNLRDPTHFVAARIVVDGGLGIDHAGGQRFVGLDVGLHGQPQLGQIVDARHATSRLASCLHGGQ